MKRILIMRHAKAEKDYVDKTDFERDLTEKGRKAAKIVGEKLLELGIIPDYIIASAASRTTQTAEIVADQVGYKKDIDLRRDYYFGDENEIIEDIKLIDNEVDTVMIVGHNPTVTYLANILSDDQDFIQMKTANLAVFECDINKWNDFHPDFCKMIHFIDHRHISPFSKEG